MAMLSSVWKVRCQASCLALLTLSMVGGPLFAASQPEIARCERFLAEAKRVAERNVKAERVGLWERLRVVREACDASGVPATLRARAALLYRILPEYSELAPRVALFESLEADLELLPAPSPELLEVIEMKAGAFESWGKLDDASAAIEQALRVRAILYGESSPEFAEGLLGSARFHAALSENSSAEREIALDLAGQAIEIVRSASAVPEDKRRKVLDQVGELLRELGLTPEEVADRIAVASLGS